MTSGTYTITYTYGYYQLGGAVAQINTKPESIIEKNARNAYRKVEPAAPIRPGELDVRA